MEYFQSHENALFKDEVIGPKQVDPTRMLFFAEYCEPKLSSAANRLASLFPAFVRFHIFLQTWGITELGTGELFYDFEKSLECEKDLDIEADQLHEALDNLYAYLFEDSELSFQVRQQLLIERNIIHVLLLIGELINAKINIPNSKKDEKSEQLGKLHRVYPAKTENEWESYEKNPQNIAKKYLVYPAKRIYKILLKAIERNAETSALIISNDVFLSGQLNYFRDEVGAILKEAIRNSEELGEADPHGDEIVEWINLLEPISEHDGNLQV